MRVGLDISAVGRWEKILCDRPDLLTRVFTEEEIAHANKKGMGKAASYAALWAAREAAGKALGTGFAGASWKDAFVSFDDSGAPHLHLSGLFQERAESLGVHDMALSISHETEWAAAVVIMT